MGTIDNDFSMFWIWVHSPMAEISISAIDFNYLQVRIVILGITMLIGVLIVVGDIFDDDGDGDCNDGGDCGRGSGGDGDCGDRTGSLGNGGRAVDDVGNNNRGTAGSLAGLMLSRTTG